MAVKTVSYFAPLAQENERWMVCAILPNGQRWEVYSFGATEEAAREKIVALAERELAKYANHPKDESAAPKTTTEPGANRFAGTTWIIHKTTREKRRAPSLEADILIATGEWERGGPRSK